MPGRQKSFENPEVLNKNSDSVTLVESHVSLALGVLPRVRIAFFLKRCRSYTGPGRHAVGIGASSARVRVAGEKISAIAAETFQKEPLDLVLPNEYHEYYDTLQSVCQVSYVPQPLQLFFEQPRYYFRRPVYTHNYK